MIAAIPTLLTEPSPEVAELFQEQSPILVEVRFPRMGTAPDWYLCHEVQELVSISQRLGAGAELHLHSVWNLENSGSPLVVCNADLGP